MYLSIIIYLNIIRDYAYNHVIILSVEFFYENIHISYLFGNVLTHNAHVVRLP